MSPENKIFIHDKQISKALRNCIDFVMFFMNPIFNCVLQLYNLLNKKESKKKYNISVCAIFKNEGTSFKEWIEYHKLIGVEHFYLYNNNSTDDFEEILEPYIKEGLVELIHWNIPPPSQFSAYENAFVKFKNESQWITYIDLDEFICPYYETSLQDWIKKYKNYPSVVVYWKMFGTSGLLEHDNNKLLVEQYTVCWNKFYDVGKCFFNTDYEIANFSLHHVYPAKIKLFGLSINIPPINEFKQFILFKSNRIGLFRSKNDFRIQINHYSSKAYITCIQDKFLKRGDVNNHERNAFTFFWHEHKNIATDFKIWRFVIELKVQMGKVKDPSIVDFTNSKY